MRSISSPLLIALALAAPASAQNLLVNPEVGGSVAPWTACPSNAAMFDDRNEQCTLSRSVVAASAQVDCSIGSQDDNQVVIRQCVPLAGTGIVPGSTAIFYSGWAAVSREQFTFLEISFFTSADCTPASGITSTAQLRVIPALQWTEFEPSPAFTVPPGSASIEYILFAVDTVDSSTFVMFLDGAYLGTAPLVFADGFEGSSQVPCRWSSSP